MKNNKYFHSHLFSKREANSPYKGSLDPAKYVRFTKVIYKILALCILLCGCFGQIVAQMGFTCTAPSGSSVFTGGPLGTATYTVTVNPTTSGCYGYGFNYLKTNGTSGQYINGFDATGTSCTAPTTCTGTGQNIFPLAKTWGSGGTTPWSLSTDKKTVTLMMANQSISSCSTTPTTRSWNNITLTLVITSSGSNQVWTINTTTGDISAPVSNAGVLTFTVSETASVNGGAQSPVNVSNIYVGCGTGSLVTCSHLTLGWMTYSASSLPTPTTAPICSGGTLQLTEGNPTLGTPNPSNGSSTTWAWSGTSGSVINPTTQNPTVTGASNGSTYTVTYTDQNNCISTATSAAVSVVSQPTCGAPTGNTTICAGSGTNLSVSPSGGTGTFSYQWQSMASNCATPTSVGSNSSSYSTGNLSTGTNYYRCIISQTGSGCGPVTTTCTVVNVLSNFSSGSITGGGGTICYGGDPGAMTASPSGGAGTFNYQWFYLDGTSCPNTGSPTSISGATSATYDPPSGLQTTRSYQCQVDATGSPDCGSSTWTSNCITVSVLSSFNSGSITGGGGTICYGGDPGTMTASPSGGAGTYNYQWYYLDGTSCPSTGSPTSISGATSATYDPPSGLQTTRSYQCQIDATGSPDCGSASWTSNCITVTVLSNFSSGSITGGGGTICYGGDPGTMTASPSGGAGTYNYQWYYLDGTSCPSTGSPTSISGATSATYDPPSGLLTTRSYQCKVDAAGSPDCSSYTWTSNCITVTVLSTFISGSITGGGGTICYNGDPGTMTANPSGGAGTYNYQWYYLDGTSCPNTGSPTSISGATSATYDPPSGLQTTRSYQCQVDATGSPDCGSATWTSNCITVTVLPNFSSGSITGGGGTICYNGDPGTMTANPSGGAGTYSYQWYYLDGTSCPNTGSPTSISGATSAIYDPPSGLQTTRSYQCQVDATGSPDCGSATWTSNCITVTVIPNFSSGSITGGGGTICYNGDPGEMTANPTGGAGTYTYQWYYLDGATCPDAGSPSIISGATSAAYDPPTGLQATRSYQCQIDATGSPDCGSATWTSNCITVTVRPNFTAGSINATGQIICYNGDPSIIGSTADASGGDGSIAYQWQSGTDGSTFPITISVSNSASYDPPSGLTQTTYYRRQAKDGTCNTSFTTSTGIWMVTVNALPTAAYAGSDQRDAATCGLTQVTLAANTPTIGIGAWSIISGTGGSVATLSDPASAFSGTAGSAYTLRWTISNSPCTASTDDVNIKFNQNPTSALAGADQTGASTCGLTHVTLAANTPGIGSGAWDIISGTGGSVATPSSPTSIFTGTAGNAYTLRWTISNNPCISSTDDVNITYNVNPVASVTGHTNVSCYGGSNGTISVGASGGSGSGYQYSLNGSSYATSVNFTGLAASTYSPVRVKDDIGCVSNNSVSQEITQPTEITFNSVIPTIVTCFGGSDGTITISSGGGTGSLQYSIDNGSNFQTGNIFTGLSADTYTIKIKDANNCSKSYSGNPVTVTQNGQLGATVTPTDVICNGDYNGIITFSGSGGGSGTYNYSITGGSSWTSSGSFTGLAPGTYSAAIQDASYPACSRILGTRTVSYPATVAITINSSANPACNGYSDGSVTLNTATGGSGSGYMYMMRLPAGSGTWGTWQSGKVFIGLANGSYGFKAKDGNGCESSEVTRKITEPASLEAEKSFTNPTCYGGTDGSILITASGGTPPYSYSKDAGTTYTSGSNPYTFYNLTATTYNIYIKDANSCESYAGASNLSNPSGITISSVIPSVVSCYGGNDGTITVIAYGGTGGLQYSNDNGINFQTDNLFAGLSAGTYNIMVKDGNACEKSYGNNPVTVYENDQLNALANATNTTCNGVNDGIITFTGATGGSDSFEYSINGGADWATSASFSGITPGTYIVKVRDANHTACVYNGIADQVITYPATLTATVSPAQPTCIGINDGTITISDPHGGYGTYEYCAVSGSWQSSGSFTGLAPGTYSVKIRDAAHQACIITLGQQVLVTIIDTQVPTITCPGNITTGTNAGCMATGVILGTPTTGDNCNVTSLTNDAPTAYALGVNTVKWTVTDGSGNTATCVQTITVTDNVPPTITCPGNITTGTNSGCTATGVILGTPITGDNCHVASTANDAPTVYSLGLTNVKWTVTDDAGNTATCNQTVTVIDNVPPTITCPFNITTVTNIACTATGVALGTPTTGDNCHVASTTNDAPTAYVLGINTVKWTVTDDAGNTASCNQTVTVTDNVKPTINCPGNITTWTNTSCTATGVALGSPTTGDDCHVLSTTNDAPTAYVLGVNIVKWTVTDDAGNTATCNQTITVFDNVPPTISCPNNITTGTNAGCTATGVILGTPITGDNCHVASFTNDAPTVYSLGLTNVKWTVTDDAGNTATCNQTVTVYDNVPPTITCPNNITAGTNTSCTATGVALGSPTTGDNCHVASTTNDAPTAYVLGINTVKWTVTDGAGNTATCNQTVTVYDYVPPTIICPDNITTGTNTGCTATGVILGTPTTGDNCHVLSTTNDAPTAYPLGLTTVKWTVTDDGGNTAICYQSVTVNDGTPPILNCPPNTTLSSGLDSCSKRYTYDVTATDNCTLGYQLHQISGPLRTSVLPLGVSTAVWKAEDFAGNTSTCRFNISVIDVQNPFINCPGNITQTADAGSCNTVVTYSAPIGTDNCSGSSIAQTTGLASGSLFPVGTTINTFVVTDSYSNTSSCSFLVIVNDHESPVITCPGDITINCQDNSSSATTGTATATDNCTMASNIIITQSDISTYSSNPSSILHYNYVITRTWKATDASGNTSLPCNQIITVQDVTKPALTNLPANVTVNCDALPTLGSPTATDNCDASPVVFYLGEVSTQGANQTLPSYYNYTLTRTWNATDVAGNTSLTATQVITVQDVTKPILINVPPNVYVTSEALIPAVGMPSAVDNCDGSPVVHYLGEVSTKGANPALPTYYNYTLTRTWDATDVSSNHSLVGTQVITVNSVVAVIITCPVSLNVTNDLNQCSAVVNVGNATATDNYGAIINVSIVGARNDGFSLNAPYPVGRTTITWTATDTYGNQSSCQQTVTVTDIQHPTITCAGNQSYNTDAGVCSYTVHGTTLNPASFSDNCSGSTISNDYTNTNTLNHAMFPKGTTTVIWTVTDAAGNQAACSTNVAVTDVQLPTITCVGNKFKNTDAGACNYTVQGTEFNPSFNDNCSGATISNNYTHTNTLAGAAFPIGTTTVIWTVTDASNNIRTCSFNVTVADAVLPTIACVGNQLKSTNAGACTYTVQGTEFNPTFSDNCGISDIRNNYNNSTSLAGSAFPKGTTTVLWTVTDISNNIRTCSFNVIVADNEKPVVIACPSNITQSNDAGRCSAVVTWTEPIATDNCTPSGSLTWSKSHTPGSTFPVGTTTVNYLATDIANNTSLPCSFNVTVADNEKPVISGCPSNITQLNDPGQFNAVVTWTEPTATDNCTPSGSLIWSKSHLPGSIFPAGTTTVTYTVKDASFNTSDVCRFNITVAGAELKVKVFLQTPYNSTTGLMNTYINSLQLIPAAQPYNSAPWNYAGAEHLRTANADIVDWVLVEVRDSNTTTVIDRRAGLLMKNGEIKDTNLTSGLIFNHVLRAKRYYITILHKNHLPVMSGSLIAIPNQTTYDFSDTLQYRPYGGGKKAMIGLDGLGSGKFAMIGGDVNNDGIISYSGANNDRAPILTKLIALIGRQTIVGAVNNIYLNEDVSMNGILLYTGAGRDPQIILQNLMKMNNNTLITGTYRTPVPGAIIYNYRGYNEGPIDLIATEDSYNYYISLKSKQTINHGLVDNIQFTISWDENDLRTEHLISGYTSAFNLTSQGNVYAINGKKYKVFATADPGELPEYFEAGQSVVILTVPKTGINTVLLKNINIAEDNVVQSIGGEYYVSVWGEDVTGKIIENTTFIDDNQNDNFIFSYYPNPALNGKFTINVSSASNQVLSLKIYDVVGVCVYDYPLDINRNTVYIKELNLEKLSKGTYLIDLSNSKLKYSGKLIIF